eukprot:9579130-Alexandrium_andersonii.AAC.1
MVAGGKPPTSHDARPPRRPYTVCSQCGTSWVWTDRISKGLTHCRCGARWQCRDDAKAQRKPEQQSGLDPAAAISL